jgi:hypothetical protein
MWEEHFIRSPMRTIVFVGFVRSAPGQIIAGGHRRDGAAQHVQALEPSCDARPIRFADPVMEFGSVMGR